MKLSLEVDESRISDLLHGHSGSYSHWLHELSGKWNDKKGAKIKFDREADDEGEGKGSMIIRRTHVVRGMSLMARHAPDAFADFLQQNDDNHTFDCALQFIVFGKEIYA